MKKQIQIHFSLGQINGSSTLFNVDGFVEEHVHFKRIIFVEPSDDNAKTVIDIYDDNRVIINRFGKIHTKMVYILNEESLATLKTDFGYEVSMSNYTHELRIESNLLAITYQTLSDKEQGGHHKLLITWKK